MDRTYFACSCRVRCLVLIVAAALIPATLFAQTLPVPTFAAGKLEAPATHIYNMPLKSIT